MTSDSLVQTDLEHVLCHTNAIWDDFRGSRIFITGGTGFIGKWLLESFLLANELFSLDAQAVVLSRNPERFARSMPRIASNSAIRLYQGDVRTFAYPDGAFKFVIHAATDAASASGELEIFDVAVAGTRRVMEFCRARLITDVLLISSGAVYGRQPPHLKHVDEEYAGAPATTLPESAYGQGKRAAEWLTSAYCDRGGTNWRIARCFAFVGPYLPMEGPFAVGNFIAALVTGGTLQVKGDGTPVRSYLYAADLAIWLWTILSRGQSRSVYNVGSEESINILELANLIARMGETAIPVNVARTPMPNVPPERYVPSTRKAREQLGLRAMLSLGESLVRTVAWARASRIERRDAGNEWYR